MALYDVALLVFSGLASDAVTIPLPGVGGAPHVTTVETHATIVSLLAASVSSVSLYALTLSQYLSKQHRSGSRTQ